MKYVVSKIIHISSPHISSFVAEKLYSYLKKIPLIVKLKNFDLIKQTTECVDRMTKGILLVVAPASSKESLHALVDKTIALVASHVDSTVDVTIEHLLTSLKSLKAATKSHGVSLYNACDANKAFVDAISLAKEKLPEGVTSRLESVHNYAVDTYTSSMSKAMETKESIVTKATEAAKSGYDTSLPYAIKVLGTAQPYVVRAVNMVSPIITSASPLVKKTYSLVEPVVASTRTYVSENKTVGPYLDKSIVIANEFVDRTVEYCTDSTVIVAQSAVSSSPKKIVSHEDTKETIKTPTVVQIRGQMYDVDDWPPKGTPISEDTVMEELHHQDFRDLTDDSEDDDEISFLSH